MGGRKKKFIDKRKSATFQLLARDTSSSLPPTDGSSDRVFVRVDNNPYTLPGDDSPELSAFADASEEGKLHPHPPPTSASALPDHVRREILELGLPDDGYNYLLHLREIQKAGGGSAYFQNDRARMNLVPVDVRSYDASMLRIPAGSNEEEVGHTGGLMCAVASGAVGTRAARAVDPDVARLLGEDDGGGSLILGSDVGDLEEDFVAMANREEGGGRGKFDGDGDRMAVSARREEGVKGWLSEEVGEEGYEPIPEFDVGNSGGEQNPRARRLLDAQFELLALREYDTESDSDGAEYMEKEVEPLAAKLNNALKDYAVDDLELEDTYRVPADFIRHVEGNNRNTMTNSFVEVLRKCEEYAEMYIHDDIEKDREVVLLHESSDESEVWDCETIVTTYSNLDNHPGKISAPERPKKKLPELINGNGNVISLRGKDKIPLDYLPNNRTPAEKVKKLGVEQHHKRTQDESKETKKERKAAVKEEKREARRAKKELKQLYRSEAQKAQHVAACTGPSSIHLM